MKRKRASSKSVRNLFYPLLLGFITAGLFSATLYAFAAENAVTGYAWSSTASRINLFLSDPRKRNP